MRSAFYNALNFHRPPMKLQEGNVFSRVWLSVYSCVPMLSLPGLFKLFTWEPTPQPQPKPCPYLCSNLFTWEEGGWLSTEKSSGFTFNTFHIHGSWVHVLKSIMTITGHNKCRLVVLHVISNKLISPYKCIAVGKFFIEQSTSTPTHSSSILCNFSFDED